MFVDGLNIMVLGMGIVFIFLLIIYVSLVLSSILVSKFHLRFNPEPLHILGDKEDNQEEVIAAISAAAVYCKN